MFTQVLDENSRLALKQQFEAQIREDNELNQLIEQLINITREYIEINYAIEKDKVLYNLVHPRRTIPLNLNPDLPLMQRYIRNNAAFQNIIYKINNNNSFGNETTNIINEFFLQGKQANQNNYPDPFQTEFDKKIQPIREAEENYKKTFMGYDTDQNIPPGVIALLILPWVGLTVTLAVNPATFYLSFIPTLVIATCIVMTALICKCVEYAGKYFSDQRVKKAELEEEKRFFSNPKHAAEILFFRAVKNKTKYIGEDNLNENALLMPTPQIGLIQKLVTIPPTQ